jgi:hypothetical protein
VQDSDKAGGGAELPEDGAHGERTEGAEAAATGPPAGPAPRADAQPDGAAVRPPTGSQAEQDAIFRELVASFDDPVDLRTWPASEDLADPGGSRGGLADFAPQPRPKPGGPLFVPGSGPRDWQTAEDPDEDHFIPPEPPPLPALDVTSRFAWLAVLGGPALLIFSAVVWQEISGWPALVGITAFVGGFGTLVARMKDSDEDDEDPQGGAVV